MRFAFLFLVISFQAIGQNAQGLRFIQNKGQWNDGIDFLLVWLPRHLHCLILLSFCKFQYRLAIFNHVKPTITDW